MTMTTCMCCAVAASKDPRSSTRCTLQAGDTILEGTSTAQVGAHAIIPTEACTGGVAQHVPQTIVRSAAPITSCHECRDNSCQAMQEIHVPQMLPSRAHTHTYLQGSTRTQPNIQLMLHIRWSFVASSVHYGSSAPREACCLPCQKLHTKCTSCRCSCSMPYVAEVLTSL